MNMDKFGIRHSPLTDSFYLCRFGKDPHVSLDKRDIEPEIMEAITNHMMLDAPKGSRKAYKIRDQWYEIKITPLTAQPEQEPHV